MAQKIITELLDDIDSSPADETMPASVLEAYTAAHAHVRD